MLFSAHFVMLYFAHPDYCFGLSDVSVSCKETIFRDINDSSGRTDNDRNAIINVIVKMVSVQETETSDLNQNNDLDERNTILQTTHPPKTKINKVVLAT